MTIRYHAVDDVLETERWLAAMAHELIGEAAAAEFPHALRTALEQMVHLFLTTSRGYADGERRGARSNRRVALEKRVSVGRVFTYLQIDTGPRLSPSACSELLKQKTR